MIRRLWFAVAISVAASACSVPAEESTEALLVDLGRVTPIGEISPLIRGLSGDTDTSYDRDVGATVGSWGGNPSTRYNYMIGNAWNAARDWGYRNTNYEQRGAIAELFLEEATRNGITARLAVPTLGWVAKNTDDKTCSFPDQDGNCTDAGGATCEKPGPRADPRRTSVESTPESLAAWIAGLIDRGRVIPYVAFDNEPELWGHTHYDVHPSCPTFQELLDVYLRYAAALRPILPDAQFLGPVMCCWFPWWRTAPPAPDGSKVDFLSWFLKNVRRHDERQGWSSLDVVDVRYYPQSDVFNDTDDPATAARRLRSPRALYDPDYIDESWIRRPIAFIPEVKRIIADSYPGRRLAISEWNFGSDTTMNGALTIAEVLALYGREGVDLAAYWRSPPRDSPGYFAFKMHGNYDDQGSAFEGTALRLPTAPDPDLASIFAATTGECSGAGCTGQVKLMIINKHPSEPLAVDMVGVASQPARLFTYSEENLDGIVESTVEPRAGALSLVVPAYSITVVVLGGAA